MKGRKVLFIDTAHPILMLELEKDGFQCDAFPDYGRDDYKKIIKDYTGVIIRSKVKLDADFLARASSLKFIGRVGAGMENIDLDYAHQKGIVCINAPEGNRDAVGEQAIGMLLSLMNNLLVADQEVRKGKWEREQNRGYELGGKTIGIIGYGNTGSAFAKKLSGFDMRVLAYDKYKSDYSNEFVKESNMATLYESCDVLSLHVPLTNETYYLVDHEYLNRFKKPIYVVNTSRGKVVHTKDLVANLENGKVIGACLDVLEYEGLSFESLDPDIIPETFHKLIAMKNVILSPHIAGWTHESNYKLAMTIVKKVRKLNL
ncbi:MAG: hydroxyacid dehydrogenase [Bacteroidetes bacterium]|nr:hydroxyacid dehydrogenase [Bacteroidota bacterium]